MQKTSELWKQLFQDRESIREYAFDVNGVWYGPEAEVSHSVSARLFDSFGVGSAMCATLTMSLFAEEFPRGAVVRRYIRLVKGSRASEWLPKGVFFTNRRTVEDGCWAVEAYDAMLKADVAWTPKLTFPCTMEEAVRDIAAAMEVELDPRNVYRPYVMAAYPAGEYLRRDALCDIAAAHGGNWCVSDTGKLRLVPLVSFPPESHYLVTEHGEPILFGGDRVLVGDSAQTAGAEGAAKCYAGLDLTGCEDHGRRPPITSVSFQVDADTVVTAGTFSGTDLYAVCPYADQQMALDVLLAVRGYEYQAFRAENANLDPAAELGDGVDAGGLYGGASALDEGGDGYVTVSAPGEDELEDEYPYRSQSARALDGTDSLRAFITKALGEMQIELNSLKTAVQELSGKVDDISGRVTDLESRVKQLGG